MKARLDSWCKPHSSFALSVFKLESIRLMNMVNGQFVHHFSLLTIQEYFVAPGDLFVSRYGNSAPFSKFPLGRRNILGVVDYSQSVNWYVAHVA